MVLVVHHMLPHGPLRDLPVLLYKAILYSCLCGVDSVGEPYGHFLVAISSVKFLSRSVSALVQCSFVICIYSRDPINFMSNYSINCTGWMGVITLLFSKFHKLLHVTFFWIIVMLISIHNTYAWIM